MNSKAGQAEPGFWCVWEGGGWGCMNPLNGICTCQEKVYGKLIMLSYSYIPPPPGYKDAPNNLLSNHLIMDIDNFQAFVKIALRLKCYNN